MDKLFTKLPKGVFYGLFVFSWISISLQAANFVSHYGVTVHFADDHLIGKFANGEPWVVGPVTVTGIDKPSAPADPAYPGGAMVNPVPGFAQGFCPNYTSVSEHPYNPKLDVSLNYPFTVNAGDSLIVARSIPWANHSDGGGYDACVDVVVGMIFLAEPPPADSFRPGLYGKDHAVRFSKRDIDYTVLKHLGPVPATPTQAYMEASYRCPALPWWEWTKEWTGSFIRPLENCGTGNGAGYRSQYGREAAVKWSDTALWLNTANTNAVKEKVMIQTIQAGLDIGSYFKNGGSLISSGGHQVGHKFPLLLAAAALKDPELLAYASNAGTFIEDQTTFFVQQEDVGRPVEGGIAATYVQEDVGIAEWGINHSWNPSKDDRRWADGIPYRFVQWPAMTGQLLAAEIMGIKELWGHPPIFAYNERFIAKQGGLADNFVGQMWKKYKSDVGNPSTPQGLRIKK